MWRAKLFCIRPSTHTIWETAVVSHTSTLGTCRNIIEPIITLASFTHMVPNINLGVSVLVLPQRNVFVVAKQIAALDLLSDGRFTLGLGVGWREDEFDLLGADFANRGAIADEAIQVLHTLWRDPEASFDGRFYQKLPIGLPINKPPSTTKVAPVV